MMDRPIYDFPTSVEAWEEWKKDRLNWQHEADWREWMEENGYEVKP